MAYFSAVLARSGEGWQAPDVLVDGAEDLDALAELIRQAAAPARTALLLLQQEDQWFAVVRVDGDADPKVFVSDAAAASGSPYAELLGVETLDEDLASEPVGDFDVLADLGVHPGQLEALCDGRRAVDADDALGVIAEAAGFDDVLEALR